MVGELDCEADDAVGYRSTVLEVSKESLVESVECTSMSVDLSTEMFDATFENIDMISMIEEDGDPVMAFVVEGKSVLLCVVGSRFGKLVESVNTSDEVNDEGSGKEISVFDIKAFVATDVRDDVRAVVGLIDDTVTVFQSAEVDNQFVEILVVFKWFPML